MIQSMPAFVRIEFEKSRVNLHKTLNYYSFDEVYQEFIIVNTCKRTNLSATCCIDNRGEFTLHNIRRTIGIPAFFVDHSHYRMDICSMFIPTTATNNLNTIFKCVKKLTLLFFANRFIEKHTLLFKYKKKHILL